MKHLSANILLCSLLICNGCDNSHEPYNNGYDKPGQGRSARNLSVGKRRIYQTSTEFNRQLSWIIVWGFLDDWDRIGIKGYDKNANSYLIYPFFAF